LRADFLPLVYSKPKNLSVMNSTSTLSFRYTLLLAFFVLLITSCKQKPGPVTEIDPEFTSYITAFTSGHISNEAGIRIRLAEDFTAEGAEVELNQSIEDKLFKFQPSLKGTAYFIDPQTIEFKPDKRMESGTVYNASFYLSRITEVPDHLKTFNFQFQTIQQSFTVDLDALKPYSTSDLRWHKLNGVLMTADVIEDSEIEKVLVAKQGGKRRAITWNHDPEGKIHEFVIDSLNRTENEETVDITWDGEPVKINVSGSETITIPALGDFSLMNISICFIPS